MGGQLRKRKPNLLWAVLCTDSATIGQLRSTAFRPTWWMRGLRGARAARAGPGGEGGGGAGLRAAGDPRALTRTLCSFPAWRSASPSRWSAWESAGGRAGRPLAPRPGTCSPETAGRSSRVAVSALSGRAGTSGARKSLLAPRRGSRAGVLAGRGGRVGRARGEGGPAGDAGRGSGGRACQGPGGRWCAAGPGDAAETEGPAGPTLNSRARPGPPERGRRAGVGAGTAARGRWPRAGRPGAGSGRWTSRCCRRRPSRPGSRSAGPGAC